MDTKRLQRLENRLGESPRGFESLFLRHKNPTKLVGFFVVSEEGFSCNLRLRAALPPNSLPRGWRFAYVSKLTRSAVKRILFLRQAKRTSIFCLSVLSYALCKRDSNESVKKTTQCVVFSGCPKAFAKHKN